MHMFACAGYFECNLEKSEQTKLHEPVRRICHLYSLKKLRVLIYSKLHSKTKRLLINNKHEKILSKPVEMGHFRVAVCLGFEVSLEISLICTRIRNAFPFPIE